MIRRMSDEHKINFLELNKKIEIEKISSEVESKTLKQVAEEQKSKKLSNKDDGLMTSHYISSARTGDISNNGGPTKFTKSESSNTIFDTDKSVRLSKEIDSKTRVKNEKEEIASNKRIAENKRMQELADNLSQTDQSKDISVSSMGRFSGSNYYSPKNNISIFDTEEFERLADKTSGEKVSEEVNLKNSQKDESWKNDGKTFSSKDVLNNLFNNLNTKREE